MKKAFLIVVLCASSSWATFSGYTYRREIVIDASKVGAGVQTNFPVLVSTFDITLTTQSSVGHLSNANGFDLVFSTMSDCSFLLNWDTETVNNVGVSTMNVWVNIPAVSNVTDTPFFMCYGNAGISTYQGFSSATWNSNYLGVWHLQDGTNLNLRDATSNANLLTNNNSISVAVGQVDGCATSLTSNTNKDLTIASNLGISGGNVTENIWVNINTAPTSGQTAYLASNLDGTTHTSYDILYVNTGGTLSIKVDRVKQTISNNQVTVNSDMGTGNWHKIDLVYNTSDTTLRGYLDGVTFGTPLSTSGNGGGATASITSLFSPRSIASLFLSGKLDEYRISSVGQSADWIKTEYNNQSSPSTFYAIGPEIQSPVASVNRGLQIKGGSLKVQGSLKVL